MLFLAPHTVTVQKSRQAKDARHVAGNVAFADAYTIAVCINSKDQGETFNAVGVDYQRPHKMLMDLADAGKVASGDQIKWGTRLFSVRTPVRVSAHGLVTDHASVMLEEIES